MAKKVASSSVRRRPVNKAPGAVPKNPKPEEAPVVETDVIEETVGTETAEPEKKAPVKTEPKKEAKKAEPVKKAEPAKKAEPSKPKKESRFKGADPLLMISFIVFMLASVCVLGSFINSEYINPPEDPKAAYGSSVTVDYTGSYYGYYDVDGSKVFDTSIADIGNSDSYAKSYEYTKRTSYSSLTMSVTEESGYLAGFTNAVIGHSAGETVKVKIDAADAYGLIPTADYKSGISSTVTGVPVSQTITATEFEDVFGFELTGNVFDIKSPVYGWNVDVYYSTSGTYTIVNNPVSGEEYTIPDTPVKVSVTSVSSTIGFDYDFSECADYTYSDAKSDIELVKLYCIDGNGFTPVYVCYFDETAGTFGYKTCDEKVGMDLYFAIKIISVA